MGLYVSCLLLCEVSTAQEQYNASFIRGDAAVEMVNLLASGDDILPGTYPFDIYLNDQQIDQRELTFSRQGKDSPVAPCLTLGDYREYGVHLPASPGSGGCYDLVGALGDVKMAIDAGIHRLDLYIPQLHLVDRPQGAVSPKLYDQGITAGYLNYNLNGTQSRNKNDASSTQADYYFASVNSGLNLGGWRLRNDSTVDRQPLAGTQWRNIATWAETDLVPWRSRLLIGQGSTDNAMFDSFSFSGMHLASSREMLPESLRGYAPVIRGVAASNARVEIRQNGYTVYSTQVPAGPFALRDVYPGSLSGDLQVSVIEADGSRKHFTVPFSAVPNMLRDGITDYQLSLGRYRDGRSGYQPRFVQAGIARGLSREVTPYGGLLVAENYRAAVVGLGKNLGLLGAISLDLSLSDTDLAAGDSKRGQSLRFLYSKSLNTLGTEFRLAGYRYSTAGYYDFADAVAERDRWDSGLYRHDYLDDTQDYRGVPDWTEARKRSYYSSTFNNKRQRLDLSVNQRVGNASSVYVNVSNQSYWGEAGQDRTLQAGFNSVYKDISYGVFLQDTRSNMGYDERSVNLTLSVPLGSGSRYLNSTSSVNHTQRTGSTYNTGINGTLLDDSRLNYGAQVSHNVQAGASSSVSLGYQGSKGNVDFNHSYGRQFQQTSLGVSGGLVVHAGGVTLSQPLHDTLVLVEARGAEGVGLDNQGGAAIDKSGFTVMTSATPYRQNRVALRTEDIGAGLEIPMPAREVVPTRGAIVRVRFDTHQGRNLLVHSTLADGSVPPIGATVFGRDGRSNGVVGTGGEIFIAGVADGDRLLVKWGSEAGDACSLVVPAYHGNAQQPVQGYDTVSLICNTAPEASRP
ncbi:fimbria/pilus outer membrane usher protein [Pseudomonas fluorescens]|uniref:fimbria/pilus outer membrane usher protein n=1 Tax=Pseudomonas fluorescens TaxID=294 RepID=UPI002161E2A6|nr:fimbria/pilus outer membrane usher protein [Pseudomonas fluorescens]